MSTMQDLCSLIHSDECGQISAKSGNSEWTYCKYVSESGTTLYTLKKQFKGKTTTRLVMFEPCNDWFLGIIHRLYKRTTKPSSVPSNIY